MAGLGVGAEFAGYRVERLLSRGGMSVVYLAEDLKLGRRVTLKILAPDLADDPSFRARFINESRTAAGLDHPNIVPIYAANEAEGVLFIAMRYVRGTDLDVLIREEGPLSLRRTAAIVRQVASALDAAHREGLVHRDVKPANILVTPGSGPAADHAYLTDFGITKRPAHGAITTRTGEIMGTVDYVAPEQVEGKPVDFRADVYSLGCVAYQSLTGRVPFPRESDLATLWAHVHEKPPRASADRPDLPPAVDTALARAMSKEPKDRYDSCGAFASSLEDGLEVTPPPSRAIRSPRRPRRPSNRALAIVAAAAVAVGGVLAWIDLTRGSPASPCPTFGGTRKRLERVDPQVVTRVTPAPALSEKIAVDPRGLIWVTTPAGVDVLCSPSGQAGGVIPLPFTPKDLAVGDSGVWVVGRQRGSGSSPGGGGRAVRIIDASGRKDQVRDLQDVPDHVLAGAAGVWFLSDSGTLTRLARPSAGSSVGLPPQTLSPVRVGAGASAAAADDDTAVWVANDASGTLRSVDPESLHLGKPVTLPAGAGSAVAVANGIVWCLDPEHEKLVPVSEATGRQVGRPIGVGKRPLDVISGNRYLWVANGWSVWRIDPLSRRIKKKPIPGRVLALAVQPYFSNSTREQAVWVLFRQRA